MDRSNRKIPQHLGIIPDGNRRWALERNLNVMDGYQKEMEKIKQVPFWFFARGVKAISFFVFPQSHWERDREEVNYFMKVFKNFLEKFGEKAEREGIKIILTGRVDELPGDLPFACQEAEDRTKNAKGGIINLCVNYNGRSEIVEAVKKIFKTKPTEEQIHEGLIGKYLYHDELGDMDLVVRTSGEYRHSGFLLWQQEETDFIFLKKYWPDFEERDADSLMEEYAKRMAGKI